MREAKVSEETKMEIDHDCYNFSSEDDFSKTMTMWTKMPLRFTGNATSNYTVTNKYLVNPNPI